jgi:hypothetical protein
MTTQHKIAETGDTTWLAQSFRGVQKQLETKLQLASVSISHGGTQGDVTEGDWVTAIRSYLPNRYQIEKAIVVDSLGQRSDQIDIVIFDRHFTPTLLDQQQHRYIPAEAVYAVFEAKPHIDKAYLDYASAKAASVRRLHRTSVQIAHAGGTFAPRTPFEIVGGIVAPRTNWADGLGASFKEHLQRRGENRLDCGCALAHGNFDLFTDGELAVGPSDCALMRFLFRLLGKLQSLGTVTAIDWNAYARTLGRENVVPTRNRSKATGAAVSLQSQPPFFDR